MIMVRKELLSTPVENEDLQDIEAVACQIYVQNRTLLLACYYRPPNSSKEYSERIRVSLVSNSNFRADQVLMCGDFNHKEID